MEKKVIRESRSKKMKYTAGGTLLVGLMGAGALAHLMKGALEALWKYQQVFLKVPVSLVVGIGLIAFSVIGLVLYAFAMHAFFKEAYKKSLLFSAVPALYGVFRVSLALLWMWFWPL